MNALKRIWSILFGVKAPAPLQAPSISQPKDFAFSRLEMRHGDILVVRVDGLMTREQIQRIKADFETQFNGVFKVMVLINGVDLAVLSPPPVSVSSACSVGRSSV